MTKSVKAVLKGRKALTFEEKLAKLETIAKEVKKLDKDRKKQYKRLSEGCEAMGFKVSCGGLFEAYYDAMSFLKLYQQITKEKK